MTAGRCLRCESESSHQFIHRELVILAVLVGVIIAAFLATRSLASSNEALHRQDARTWYSLGEQALQRQDLDTAVAALRRARAKDPENPVFRLALAQTLLAAHQDEAARQLLLGLREQQPEDPETNLELARLEARGGDQLAASRFYETAMVGLWEAEQRPAQREVRTEFIEFLLRHGERNRALSELLVLEATLPDDRPLQLAAGMMLLAAGDARRAADHFARVLRANPDDQGALAGAGEASFELSDYARARRYLNALKEDTDRSRALRTLANLIFSSDPLASRLPMVERRRRLTADLAQLIRRLESCRARPPSERLNGGIDLEPVLLEASRLDAALSARNRQISPDQIEAGFDQIAHGERVADQACGSPEPLDEALLLIARSHGLGDQ